MFFAAAVHVLFVVSQLLTPQSFLVRYQSCSNSDLFPIKRDRQLRLSLKKMIVIGLNLDAIKIYS